VGRPRLATAVKQARGTLRPHRERSGGSKGVPPEKSAHAPNLERRDYIGIAAGYMVDVSAGRIPACEDLRLAVWARRSENRPNAARKVDHLRA
jgi:hypothetical protein